MPKVKNYTADHSSIVEGYRWINDLNPNIMVDIIKENGYWRVQVWNYAKCTELGPLSKNKEEMRKVAVQWMKENPNGWEPNEF